MSFAYVKLFALDLNYIQRYRSPELIKIAQIISATGAEAFYIGIPCISTDRQSAAKNKQLYHRAFFTFCLRFSSFSRLFCISVGGAFLVLLGRSPEHSTGNLQPAEGKTANFNAYFRLFFFLFSLLIRHRTSSICLDHLCLRSKYLKSSMIGVFCGYFVSLGLLHFDFNILASLNQTRYFGVFALD